MSTSIPIVSKFESEYPTGVIKYPTWFDPTKDALPEFTAEKELKVKDIVQKLQTVDDNSSLIGLFDSLFHELATDFIHLSSTLIQWGIINPIEKALKAEPEVVRKALWILCNLTYSNLNTRFMSFIPQIGQVILNHKQDEVINELGCRLLRTLYVLSPPTDNHDMVDSFKVPLDAAMERFPQNQNIQDAVKNVLKAPQYHSVKENCEAFKTFLTEKHDYFNYDKDHREKINSWGGLSVVLQVMKDNSKDVQIQEESLKLLYWMVHYFLNLKEYEKTMTQVLDTMFEFPLNIRIQLYAFKLLPKIGWVNTEFLRHIIKHGGAYHIVQVMEKYPLDREIQHSGCFALGALSGYCVNAIDSTKYYILSSNYGIIEAIIQAKKNFPDDESMQTTALIALCSLSYKNAEATLKIKSLGGFEGFTNEHLPIGATTV